MTSALGNSGVDVMTEKKDRERVMAEIPRLLEPMNVGRLIFDWLDDVFKIVPGTPWHRARHSFQQSLGAVGHYGWGRI